MRLRNIFILLFAALTFGCGQSKHIRHSLDYASSIMKEHPDSARAILANMKNQWIEQPNCAMNGIPAYQLCEAYEAGKLKGKLKEVASKLKEDDNDVIIIYKFK